MMAPDSQRVRSVLGSMMAGRPGQLYQVVQAEQIIRASNVPGARPFGLIWMKGGSLMFSNLMDLISYGTWSSSRMMTTWIAEDGQVGQSLGVGMMSESPFLLSTGSALGLDYFISCQQLHPSSSRPGLSTGWNLRVSQTSMGSIMACRRIDREAQSGGSAVSDQIPSTDGLEDRQVTVEQKMQLCSLLCHQVLQPRPAPRLGTNPTECFNRMFQPKDHAF